MMTIYDISVSTVVKHFERATTRLIASRRWLGGDVTIHRHFIAVICDADGWVDVENCYEIVRSMPPWLTSFSRALSNGIPSHDTFEVAFLLYLSIPSSALFMRWMRAISIYPWGSRSCPMEKHCVTHFDTNSAAPIHMVSAQAT